MAFNAFEDALNHDFEKAFTDGFTALKGLPGLKGDCTSISDDIATLEAVVADLESQTDLKAYIKKKITRHIVVLTADLAKAKSYYAGAHYFEFGMELGTMAAIVLQ